jgi:hypothetical protein
MLHLPKIQQLSSQIFSQKEKRSAPNSAFLLWFNQEGGLIFSLETTQNSPTKEASPQIKTPTHLNL